MPQCQLPLEGKTILDAYRVKLLVLRIWILSPYTKPSCDTIDKVSEANHRTTWQLWR
nr:MAG TPA: hypothetical protein [Caudoviricetes sp.]